jgi:hypothetical protein
MGLRVVSIFGVKQLESPENKVVVSGAVAFVVGVVFVVGFVVVVSYYYYPRSFGFAA